jgi:hypothetical protein
MPPGNTSIVMKTVALDGSAQSYRLGKITEIQTQLEREREKRSALSTKYNRSVKIINGIDVVLGMATMGLAISGIGVLSTVVAAPVVIAMEGIAIVAVVLRFIGGRANKTFAVKAEKHENIKTLVEAKLSTISEYISKALEDGGISDDEYCLILHEFEKYNEMKEEIRSKIKVGVDEDAENLDRVAMIESLGKSMKTQT